MAYQFNAGDSNARYTFVSGDLGAKADNSSQYQIAKTDAYKASGKWYCEFNIPSGSGTTYRSVGLTNAAQSVADGQKLGGSGSNSYGLVMPSAGAAYINFNGSSIQTGLAAVTSGAIIGMEFDADARTLQFYLDGAALGSLVSSVASGSWAPAVTGKVGELYGFNSGTAPFAYLPSTGFSRYDDLTTANRFDYFETKGAYTFGGSTFVTLSNGDLTAVAEATSNDKLAKTTHYPASGKKYAEFVVGAVGTSLAIGLSKRTVSIGSAVTTPDTVWYSAAGTIHAGGALTQNSLATYTTSDAIGVAYDADSGTVRFYKNGAQIGVAETGLSAGYAFAVHLYNANGVTVNFGATSFAYVPPSGYVGVDAPPPGSTGQGAGTLEAITGVGQRVAAAAGVLQAITGIGGRLPWGEASLLPIVGLGSGGRNYGEASLLPLTGATTGHDENDGVGVLEAITGEGTGGPQSYWTLAGVAPAPSLAASLFSGNALVLVGAAPPPLLVATCLNPAVITAAMTAPAPRLVATLLTGNVLTAALTAPSPILVAVGHPPYVLTFAGSAPAPRLSASLVAAVASTFRTWALNVRRGALTEYTNFEFNSYAIWNGQVLAVGVGGLVALDTSELDGATAITGVLRTGKHDFGTSQLKRVPRVYFGGAADGDVTFRTITGEGGTRGYVLPFNGATGTQQRRVPVGKGPKSAWWQFEVESDSDFAVDRLLVYPVALRRRVQ